MAKFKNSFKRRPWESPEQKRIRKAREERLMRLQQRMAAPSWRNQKAQELLTALRRTEEAREEVAAVLPQLFNVATRIPAAMPAKKETWSEYLSPGLWLYRFQKWFQSLWAAARFGQNSGPGWLLASRHQTRIG